MAKPPSHSDVPYLPVIFSEPISFPGRATKKRTHNFSDDSGIDRDDDSQKTRRVNPQRLAARLGPEIVADMEALIYPGAKMPSFEVRRVIQERYSVDRRHIYDYFHSRGLRVAKEDRHINLTRGRLSKAVARQPVEKSPPVTSSDAMPSAKIPDCQPEEKENHQRTSTEKDLPTIETQIAPTPSVKHTSAKHMQIFEELSSRNAKLVASERITGQSGLNNGRSRHSASEGVAHLPRNKPLFKRRKMTHPTTSKPMIGSPPARTSSPCPVFAPTENAFNSSDDDLSISDASPELFLDVTESLNIEFPFDDYKPKTPAIIEEHRALTQAERKELYNFINDNIGISSGTMEQAGTYTAFMKERTQHYYDRILSKAYYVATIFPEPLDGLFSASNVSADEVDFRSWLSDYGQDENSRVNSRHHSEELMPYDGKAIHGSLELRQHDSIRQESGRLVLSSHLSKLEPPTMDTRLGPMHYDYSVDPSTTRTSQPDKSADCSETQTLHSILSHPRRHNARLRSTPFIQKTATQNIDILHNASTLPPNGLSEISNPLPDYNNRLFLHISRSRVRTSSAGGGL